MLWLLALALLARIPEEFRGPGDSLNLGARGRWNRGTVQAVEYRAGRVYCATAASVLTVRDTVAVSRVELPGIAQDIALDGDYLYVAGGNAGLLVLSLADPDQPLLIAAQALPGYAWALSKEDSIIMVALGSCGLALVNATRPAEPAVIMNLAPAETVYAAVLHDGIGYLAAGRQGLVILDAGNLQAIHVAARLNVPGSAQSVSLRGSFALVACGDSGSYTVNVANPHAPTPVRRDQWTGARRVIIRDSLAVIAAGYYGVWLLNVRYPDAPYLYAWLGIGDGYIQDIALAGDTMWVAAGPGGLRRFNIARYFEPESVATLRQPGYTMAVAVRDDVAWVACSEGLFGIDLQTPRLSELGSCSLPQLPVAVAILGDRALVTLGPVGLGVVAVGDPARPVYERTIPIPGLAMALAVRDSWAWVGTRDSGVQILMFADPVQPRYAGSLPFMNPVLDLDQADSLLVIAVAGNGLQFASITDPAHPVLRGQLMVRGRINAVRVQENRVFAAGDSGLFLVDAANTRNPQLTQRVKLIAPAWDVAVQDTICYVAEDWAGLTAFSVRDPRIPWLTGYYAGASIVAGVALSRSGLVAVDRYSGLLQLGWNPAAGIGQEPVRPGPLLRMTSVAPGPHVEVSINGLKTAARLELISPAGRRLATAPVAPAAGEQFLQFATEPLCAGVYFLRLSGAGGTTVVRTTVVR